MIIIVIIIRLKFSSFFNTILINTVEVGLKKTKEIRLYCLQYAESEHASSVDLKGVLSVTDQLGFSTVTPLNTKIIWNSLPFLSTDFIMQPWFCQLEQLKSPWHGKKTWGAQLFVQSSQGCQSNGFDGSPFHTCPWCTTPSKRILISDSVTHLYCILFSTESKCFAGRILVTEGFYAFRVSPTNKSPES